MGGGGAGGAGGCGVTSAWEPVLEADLRDRSIETLGQETAKYGQEISRLLGATVVN